MAPLVRPASYRSWRLKNRKLQQKTVFYCWYRGIGPKRNAGNGRERKKKTVFNRPSGPRLLARWHRGTPIPDLVLYSTDRVKRQAFSAKVTKSRNQRCVEESAQNLSQHRRPTKMCVSMRENVRKETSTSRI